MGLFSTLTSSATEGAEGKTRTSTLDIPNVIQLYSGTPIIVEKNGKSRKFSVLSYQTVHVSSSAAYEGGALLSKQEQEATTLHPNLGIWNCRVTKAQGGITGGDQKPLADEIFKTLPVSEAPPTICMSVDLTNLLEVEPTVTLLQDALVRYLIDRGAAGSSTESSNATTSLFDLRSTHFGLAVNDEESAKTMSASAPEEGDKKVRISLAISVMLSSRGGEGDSAGAEGSNSSYKEKQAEALVLYHLRKYAASLNAVLCFVRKEKATEEESKAIAALTLNQLSYVWHQLAKGEEGWKELDPTATEDAESEQSAVVSGIYGPGNHQEDLIEAVLLRNAQFPGQWDASKDSLWAAMPPPQVDEKNESAAAVSASGDESWLNELRSSVASEAKTPPSSAQKPDASANAKTPNDAAVSSFFESLLKP